MLLSNISSSLCDFKYLQKILIRLFTKRRNPSFKYAICGVRKWNRLIFEVKIYLLLHYEHTEKYPYYWNSFYIWLVKHRFYFCKEDENPLVNKDWVIASSNKLIEKGTLEGAIQNYVYQKILSSAPIYNTVYLCSVFKKDTSLNHPTAIIIEECSESIRYPFRSWCINAKHCGVLHPSRLPYITKIHIIYPKKQQTYHTFGLERNTHYSIAKENIDLFKWIVNALGKTIIEHLDHFNYTKSENLCVINDETKNQYPFSNIYREMKTLKNNGQLKNRNDAWLISYGFSGRVRKYAGSPPALTGSIANKNGENISLLQIALPILATLSKEILTHFGDRILVDTERNALFANKLGENYNSKIDGFNLFEGFDCAITSGISNNILSPHCDVMNDWRPGCNFCSVAKGCVADNETFQNVQIVLIAYTRKEVGDYIYGKNNFLLHN
jgi:hypothetical protein